MKHSACSMCIHVRRRKRPYSDSKPEPFCSIRELWLKKYVMREVRRNGCSKFYDRKELQ